MSFLFNRKSYERESTRKALDQFVRGEWEALARHAWNGYRSMGLGALYIDARRGKPGHTNVEYVTAVELFMQEKTAAEMSEKLAGDLATLVAGYDPEKSIVIAYVPDMKEARRLASEKAPEWDEQLTRPLVEAEPILKVYALEPAPVTFRETG